MSCVTSRLILVMLLEHVKSLEPPTLLATVSIVNIVWTMYPGSVVDGNFVSKASSECGLCIQGQWWMRTLYPGSVVGGE